MEIFIVLTRRYIIEYLRLLSRGSAFLRENCAVYYTLYNYI